MTLGVLVADQASKSWSRENLALGERVPLIADWLSAAHVESTAAAMGLFANASPQAKSVGLALISLLCVLLVLNFYRALAPGEHGTAAALGAILGGVVGNAYDRIVLGVGIDAFHIGGPDSALADFNVADVAIVLGVVTLIVELLANEMASRAEERPSA